MNSTNSKLILLISISLSRIVFGQAPEDSVSRAAGYSFADELYSQEDYSSAINEYERLDFFLPAPYPKYRIGMCHWRLGELDRAASLFRDIDSRTELIRVYFELGEYSLARFACEDTDKNQAGWIYMIEGRWDEAEHIFEEQTLKSIALAATELPYKSEGLALLLSAIVPGSGEFYAGKLVSGILTLGLNAMTGVCAVNSFRRGEYVTAGLVSSFLWHRFYHGGIVNARKSVMTYNENLTRYYVREAAKKHPCPFDL